MSENKKPLITRENETLIVRSSAAEYLTFVAAGGNSETSVEMRDVKQRIPEQAGEAKGEKT